MDIWSCSFRSDGLDELRDDDVEVADDAVVGDLEDRRVLVRVDRDDLGGVLHAGEVLDSTRDAAADHEGGTHRDAGLSDLALVLAVAEVDCRAASADRAAQHGRQVVEQLEVLLRADAGAAAYDDARALQVDGGHPADDLDDLDRYLDAFQVRWMSDDLHCPFPVHLFPVPRLHYALAHRRHLRPVARVDDRGDDVAAERGTDLVEDVRERLLRLLVLEVADLQVRAVGREAAAERRGDGRREVAPHVRRKNKIRYGNKKRSN